ncbi:toxin-antitoxin system YwqK family antitoxin [Flavobacterium sp. GT3R68]|uniref:toxin-antitoxin system YwqK family antitoxin n=1 Tax=Flavobacterium sp. GT3R68 TaxID=2594437 RepID=UPI00118537C8|nr:hypothetical protein [Flavobacterium sp. GT3R68]TRW90126.1 hypothetical protein FNW07_11755 [Flavobacterium sp. GT3R68]
MSFSDPYTIKRISDANFRYEFYTTDKKIKPKSNKIYYWFKGGAIHNAQAGATGMLLNDKFLKMYHSNQLAEQGEFKNGLKVGLWKSWHPNGTIQTTQYWDNGFRTGLYYRYDENGAEVEKGNYRSDKKHGQWVDYAKKDTVVYKRGTVFVKKPKLSKAQKAALKIEKKKASEAKKVLKETEKNQKAVAKANKKTSKPAKGSKEASDKPKKENFFKRLFSKKPSKQNTNGQGA